MIEYDRYFDVDLAINAWIIAYWMHLTSISLLILSFLLYVFPSRGQLTVSGG